MDFEVAPGTVVGGDFRVARPLASGGMGAVYVAEQISTARLRALKIMRRDLAGTPGAAERFVLEARVAARIGSDHVVEVVAAGIDPGLRAPWLAMELLEGWSLDALVRRRGRLGVPEASEIPLTGRSFWRAGAGGPGANVAQLLRAVLADPIPLASERAAEQGVGEALPRGFDAWLARCVAREPRHRFPDAASAVAALAPVVGLGHVDVAMLAAPASSLDVSAVPGRSVSPTAPTMALTTPGTPPPPRPRRRGVVAGAVVAASLGLLAAGAGVAHVAGAAGLARGVGSATQPPAPEPDAAPTASVRSPTAADAAAPDHLDGEWVIAASTKPGGGSYEGRVTITTMGTAKLVTWLLQGQVVQGLGRVAGSHLDVAFGPSPFALAVYEAKGGVLEGTLLDAGAPGLPLTERLTGASSLEGPFRIEHASTGSTGQVTITREGDRLRLVRATSASSPVGVGLRQGDRIVGAYSPTGYAGVVTYTIAPDGRSMRGVWADLTSTRTGTEDLKRP